jgi:hypothetical protein
MTHVYSFFGMDNPFLSLVFDGLQRNPSRISWIAQSWGVFANYPDG